jgi:outer membrane lipoprotein-sorting protein
MINRIISLIVLVFVTTVVNAQDTKTILLKMDRTIFAIKDKKVDVEMIMINLKNNKQKVKKAVLMQKGTDKKIFRYTEPKSDAGIATLSLPNGEVYLYLPMFKKPKKITNLAQKNSFNQSDFSLKDMATRPYSDEYIPSKISTSSKQYVLKLKPKDTNAAYSHLVVYINKSYFYPEKFEYFKAGQKVKESVYKYKKIGNYWVANSVSMKDIKKQHMTKLLMTNIKINQGLKDDIFTVDNLVSGKK